MKIDPVASLGVRYGIQSNSNVSVQLPGGIIGTSNSTLTESMYGECNASGALVSDDQQKGQIPMPPLSGDFGMLPIEPLSGDGAKKWSQERDLAFRVMTRPQNTNSPFGRYGRTGRLGFSPLPEPEPEVKLYIGKEVINYEIQSDDGTAVRIQKEGKARLMSLSSPDETFEYGGSGTWVFDKKKGMTRAIDYKGAIVQQEKSGRTQISVAMLIEDVQTPGTLASSGTPGSPGVPGSPFPPPPTTPGAPPARIELTPIQRINHLGYSNAEQAIKAIVSALGEAKNVMDRREIIQRIAVSEIVESERGNVVAALSGFLQETEGDLKAQTWKALARWDNGSKIDEATAALSDSTPWVRHAVLVYFGGQSDTRAATALAKHLERAADRSQTEFALRAFGKPAESVVIAGPLAHDDRDVRAAACRVLGAIGGPAARQALTDLVSKGDGAANEAKAALAKIH